MRILITGGAGFIGSALIRFLIESTEHTVLNVDKLTYAGNLSTLSTAKDSPRYQFYQLDICDSQRLAELVTTFQPDAIMHLAAESHVDRSITAPSAFIQTNIVGTYNLLEVARSYWESLNSAAQSTFRFHHISTDEVYGDLPHHTDDPNYSDHLFTEDTPYSPSSPYSASKASSDLLVRAWHRTYNLPTLVSNCSNNYGPYQFPEKLIPLVISHALQGKTLPIYGKGDQIRDWLYVDDHVRGLYAVLSLGQPGETYNIGGHNEIENLSVVKQICEILDELRPNSQPYSEQIRFVTDRRGHDRRYAIDASKIARKLDWMPQETFATGLRKTVEWYLTDQDWCNQISQQSSR